MALRKRKDTGNWELSFYHSGERIIRTLKPHPKTKAEAEQAAAVIMSQVFQQTYGLERTDKSFEDFLVETFLPYSDANKRSFRCDAIACATLNRFFKGYTLRQITPPEIERFKQWFLAKPIEYGPKDDRKEKKRKPATVNVHLRILSKILSMAVDADLLDSNPCRKVKQLKANNARMRVLTPSEELALLSALGGSHLQEIVLVALNTGMRKGEILGLRWDDVDFYQGVLRVEEGKTGKRQVPMNRIVRDLLQEKERGTYVFPSPVAGEKLVDIKTGFHRALRDAKVRNFRFHDLRHTAASRMADAGADAFPLCAIFGWSDIRMALRYTHSTTDAIRRAVDNLVANPLPRSSDTRRENAPEDDILDLET